MCLTVLKMQTKVNLGLSLFRGFAEKRVRFSVKLFLKHLDILFESRDVGDSRNFES